MSSGLRTGMNYSLSLPIKPEMGHPPTGTRAFIDEKRRVRRVSIRALSNLRREHRTEHNEPPLQFACSAPSPETRWSGRHAIRNSSSSRNTASSSGRSRRLKGRFVYCQFGAARTQIAQGSEMDTRGRTRRFSSMKRSRWGIAHFWLIGRDTNNSIGAGR